MGLFGKSRKQTAVAFVDYEHWFYSYTNKFNMVPNVEEWYDEICSEYKLEKLFLYGDFNNKIITCLYRKVNEQIVNLDTAQNMPAYRSPRFR